MKADVVSAGLGKRAGQFIHGLHHQVHVDGHGAAVGGDSMGFERLTHHGAKGQIWHVMVVHHVKVNPVCASSNNVANFFAQTGKVS